MRRFGFNVGLFLTGYVVGFVLGQDYVLQRAISGGGRF